MGSICLLGSTANSKGTSSQDVHFRLALGRVAMKGLKDIQMLQRTSFGLRLPSLIIEPQVYTSENIYSILSTRGLFNGKTTSVIIM